MALLPLKPKPFKQKSPVGNLGKFAHPPGKSAHKTTKVPKPGGLKRVPADGEYRPKVKHKSRQKTAMRNQQGFDASDAKTEKVTPSKQAKKAAGASYPFFGKM
jgi:hypothetical protein